MILAGLMLRTVSAGEHVAHQWGLAMVRGLLRRFPDAQEMMFDRLVLNIDTTFGAFTLSGTAAARRKPLESIVNKALGQKVILMEQESRYRVQMVPSGHAFDDMWMEGDPGKEPCIGSLVQKCTRPMLLKIARSTERGWPIAPTVVLKASVVCD